MSEEGGIKEVFAKIFDVLGQVLAFLTIIVYVIFALNANFNFITGAKFLEILNYAMYYAPLALVCIVGMEFSVRRGLLTQIIMYVLIAVVIIFQFFPGTWDAIWAQVSF